MPKRKQKSSRRQRQHRKTTSRSNSTAIVPVAAPTIIQRNRERRLRPEEVDLLKKTVAKGTTDDEFLYFMTVCRKHRIDPFTKQIYCVVWPTDNGRSHEVVIIMGIGGYRMTAARDHKDFGGTSKATFTYQETVLKTPAGRRIPESACVKALRKGGEPSEAECYWEEFAPTDLKAKRSDFWNRMPKHMLAKCAEALAIRKAFPDLSDIYTEEEVSARLADLTPGGREIVVDGVNPSGRIADSQYGSRNAAQAVAAAKIAESTGKPIEAEIVHPSQPVSQRPMRHATLDWSNPQSPTLTGDIADLVPKAKPPYGLLKGLNLVWGADSFWHVGLDAVKDLRAICAESGYELTELHPKGSGPKKEAPAAAKPSNRADAKTGAKQDSSGPLTVSGTIEKSIAGMCGTTPVRDVTLLMVDKSKPSYRCFDKKLFEHLDAGLGKVGVFVMKQNKTFLNIVGLRKIGTKEWDADGMLCIQRRDQEAGQKTLY